MGACTRCSAELPDHAKFCLECGQAVGPRPCPSCGALADRGRFCGECGSSLDPASGSAELAARADAAQRPVSERRITSVLFGDLVGFTTLSEVRDPEEVRELLSEYFTRCRTVVDRYGGTVEKFIGDAVMAVWGVPVAHEDDAERAVRAGLELTATVAGLGDEVGAQGLALRVGIVTGEVAVTLGATGEGMVAGDAVNTAARVQAAAEPGRVWVDETTRAVTSSAIAYDDTGEHALKGKAEPARLYQARAVVAEVGGGQRVDGLEAPLAGRDRELRLIKELFHATEESGRPRLVVLDGEAGVGKSRLAWEFEKYADGLTATVRWHRGRCLSYGEGVSFWALSEAVRARLGLTESDSGQVVVDRLEEGLATYLPDADERDWMRPRLGTLLGVHRGASFPRPDLFLAWSTWFERVAADADALVLVVDDAQFADEGLLDFADHLLSTAAQGIFVLALARPELMARRPDLGGRRAIVIRLDPLDAAAMAELVDGLVSGLPAASRAALVERSEGVPLFAVETVRALIDRDVVVPHEGRYVLAAGASVDLDAVGAPASLQALVAARLDALTAEERAVVADASVLGATFTREGLVALGSPVATVDALLDSLARKEILAVQQDRFAADRGQYRFVQSVVRQVAYGTLARRDRKARHLAAAGYLENLPEAAGDLAVVVAQHLLDAVDSSGTGDDDVPALRSRAGAMLELASARALALGSTAEAQRLLETALERCDDPLDQARLHCEAAVAAASSGDYRGGVEHALAAVEAFDGFDRPIDAGFAAGVGGYQLALLSEAGRAVDLCQARWEALQDVPGAERALIELGRALGRAHGDLAHADIASDLVLRRLRIAEATGDLDVVTSSLIAMGVGYHATGAPVTARALIEAGTDLARRHDRPVNLALALNNLASLLLSRDLPASVAAATEGLQTARRVGVAGMIEYTGINLAEALWLSGRLAEGVAVLDDVEPAASSPVLKLAMVNLRCRFADALGLPLPPLPEVDAGDVEAELATRADIEIWHARASGDTSAMAALAGHALPHLLNVAGIDDDFQVVWPNFAEAALADRDVPLVERLLRPVESAPPGSVSPGVRAQFRRLHGLLGALRGDDPAVVEDDLRAGAELLDEFGAVGLAARAREDLARWLVSQGRGAEAAALIAAARATYEQIGADGWRAALDAWAEAVLAAGR